MSRGPEYLFCGDDFTGASDTLATLARAGLKTRLFLSPKGLEDCRDLNSLDAAGLATANRAMGPGGIAGQMEEIAGMLGRFAPKIFHYKVCSTFDSSPAFGSIGAAVNALKGYLPNVPVVILGGQPSLGRFCTFSNLFAKGPDHEVHRLDLHPTMARHPVTPMSCADIRQILADQGLDKVRGIHWPLYAGGYEGVKKAGDEILAQGGIPLFDLILNEDLTPIGQFLFDLKSTPVLAVGASSVAQAYVATGAFEGPASGHNPVPAPEKPVFILAGSRSQATASQVAGARGFDRVAISPKEIETDRAKALERYEATCLEILGSGAHALAVVSEEMDHDLSREEIAGFTAELTSRIAFSGRIGRLGIAGGDTSSLALQRLGVESLSFLADVEPGICLCRLHAPDNPLLNLLEVALKGGQMGSPDFFTRLTGSF